MNATKMTLIATAAVLALYIFAMMNAPEEESPTSAPSTEALQEDDFVLPPLTYSHQLKNRYDGNTDDV